MLAKRLLLLATILSLIASCGGGPTTSGTEEQSVDSEAFLVQLTTVKEVEVRDPIVSTGTMMPHKLTNITPMVSGLIEDVYVQVGERVIKNQPLLKIRQIDIELEIQQLEYRVSLAGAELKDARKDLETNLGLGKKGAVSEEAADNTRTRLEVNIARLGIAEVQLNQAKQRLLDTESKAPFDGVITARNVNEGTYVQTMRVGAGGPPLLQVQKIDIIVTIVRLPESQLSNIAVGTPARVTIDSLGKSFESNIHVINDWIDNESRTIDIRIGIENKDYAIKPGLFARVEFFPPGRQALVVERNAVLGNDSTYVFVEKDGTARKIAVEIRELDTRFVEITSGLTQGQRILIGNNLARLRDGTRIRIVES